MRAPTTTTTTTRRAVLAVVLGLAVLPACSSGGSGARPAAEHFLAAWSKGDYSGAAKLTDNAPAAAAGLQRWKSTLQAGGSGFKTTSSGESGDTADIRFAAAVSLNGLGVWRFQSRLPLHKVAGRWLVRWSDALGGPDLVAGQHLVRSRALPARGQVLDRNGAPLIGPAPVVVIGVVPNRLTDVNAAVAVLQRTTGADPNKVKAAVAAAKPDAFVTVITLRRPAFDAARAALEPVPGIVFQAKNADLAPTPTFGLAVLGKVGPATAEALKAAGPGFTATDDVGLSGLEGVYQRRLAGSPSGSITVADAGGREVARPFSVPGAPGQPVRTTLDQHVQTAAEQALVGVTQPAALVAVQASTGQILAVANAPADSSYDRALAGRYPPGSSFKVVSTAALLQNGLPLGTVAACPPRVVIGGKPFTNFEGEAPGAVSFLTDFAKSCNTAFASLSQGQGTRLADAARTFGFGAKWSVPLAASSGQFTPPADDAELAADFIGQGKDLASPLNMALVAATAASGTWHPPTLVTDPAQGPAAAPTVIAPSVVDGLHQLMRAVITSGTGTAANVPGPPVYGKTGTAEFGPGNPPATHAWFIGYRGDVAFAVLVEGGGVGGRVAAPIAARFLKAAA